MKHKILSKKNKKVKQLMKRFTKESDDEESNHIEDSKPERNNSFSDINNDSFIQCRVNQESDNEEQEQLTNAENKPKTTVASVFDSILKQDLKSSNNQNPIFAEFKKPLKKVRAEIKKDRENQIKKRIKEIKAKRGHVLPKESKDGQLYEKELKIQVSKGIIKILEAVKNYQQQQE